MSSNYTELLFQTLTHQNSCDFGYCDIGKYLFHTLFLKYAQIQNMFRSQPFWVIMSSNYTELLFQTLTHQNSCDFDYCDIGKYLFHLFLKYKHTHILLTFYWHFQQLHIFSNIYHNLNNVDNVDNVHIVNRNWWNWWNCHILAKMPSGTCTHDLVRFSTKWMFFKFMTFESFKTSFMPQNSDKCEILSPVSSSDSI